ncbi:MAG: riboflavin synthase [Candidatus Omnitrophota bacterium]
MFSGIVEEKGVVRKIEKRQNLYVLSVRAGKIIRGIKAGDSVSVNGVCLTMTKVSGDILNFDLMKETILKTTFQYLRSGSEVNLERALRMSDRIGGHFVTGHVDGVGRIKKIVTLPNYVELQIAIDGDLDPYFVPKGSACIDGVSLTVGEVKRNYFSVYLIPYTLDVTTLGQKTVRDRVNIETDILAKYILAPKNLKRSKENNLS